MSFCVKCGKELNEQEKFCPECGTVVESLEEVAAETVGENQGYNVPKCFTVFGKIGPIIGLVTFILAFIPIVNIIAAEVAPIGIVFCILGKKDVTLIRKCKKGLKFSIWATILGIVLYIVYTVIFALLGA